MINEILVSKTYQDVSRKYQVFRNIDGNRVLFARFLLRKKAINFGIAESNKFKVPLVVEPSVYRRKP